MDEKTRIIRSLGRGTPRLHKPIHTTVTAVARGNFVASAPQLTLLLTATGRTRSAALRRLASGIAKQYDLLVRMPRRERAPIHRKMLQSLRRFVGGTGLEANPAGSRSEISSKARIRKRQKAGFST
jgi:hypothetical protein